MKEMGCLYRRSSAVSGSACVSLSLGREEVVFLWGHLAGNTSSDDCRFEAREFLGIFPDAPEQFFLNSLSISLSPYFL
jgi:hypothetical protein